MLFLPKAPFPYFGGKSKIASLIWQRFGDVKNYVEPFAGSLAVLFARPSEPKIETVNDKDCYLANFWRALKNDPEGVAGWADWPVNEADLHARHWWLVKQEDFRGQMKSDPDFYDLKVAGWWVWGICQWIGGGWCSVRENKPSQKRPCLSNAGRGVHRPAQQIPKLSCAGQGVHRPSQKLPALGDSGRGIHRSTNGDLGDYLKSLAARLRRVRVCCGDWSRVVTKAVTYGIGQTAIFLDPPYAAEAGRSANLYGVDDLSVAHQVRQWAIENGNNPLLRIALCGYEGEHELPEDWVCVPWKANGGYSGAGNTNRFKERVWFSPHCLNEGV